MTVWQFLALVLAVLALAGTGVSAYYRMRWKAAQAALDVMKDVRAQWALHNAELASRVERAEAALKERHAKEAADDQAAASAASGDSDRIADMLNGLHKGSAGASASEPADVPARGRTSDTVPRR